MLRVILEAPRSVRDTAAAPRLDLETVDVKLGLGRLTKVTCFDGSVVAVAEFEPHLPNYAITRHLT